MGKCYVKQSECIGEPKFFTIYEKLFKKNNNADQARAWVLMRDYGNDEADLMHVYAGKKGGYAFELMEYMKTIYHTIRTEWYGSTKDGREFCGRCGFEREGDLLVYRGDKKAFEGISVEVGSKTNEGEK